MVLRAGSLAVPVIIEEERTIGPALGQDSIDSGLRASLVGLSLILLFVVSYYRLSGLYASFALVTNLVMLIGLMSLFEATLTLPGMAGIVLTIGMAVDANVIVFERIRDYLREGFSARAAIESGYDRAFTTILDSQLTTAIAGLVLWQYGSGPIRGVVFFFNDAATTAIYTGVFCSRVFFDFQSNRRGFKDISI